jgi:hypothetical protein
MQTRKIIIFLSFMVAAGALFALQQDALPADLKDAALHDAACTKPDAAASTDGASADVPNLTSLPIRTGGREMGTIVTVQGACHCQTGNCDTLVYLRTGQGYRLALHEKYASLHPMKIVKRGMPSLTGQFEVSAAKMETTVYDWDGKDYRPSLCATVIKGKRVPSIARHPCKAAGQ